MTPASELFMMCTFFRQVTSRVSPTTKAACKKFHCEPPEKPLESLNWVCLKTGETKNHGESMFITIFREKNKCHFGGILYFRHIKVVMDISGYYLGRRRLAAEQSHVDGIYYLMRTVCICVYIIAILYL